MQRIFDELETAGSVVRRVSGLVVVALTTLFHRRNFYVGDLHGLFTVKLWALTLAVGRVSDVIYPGLSLARIRHGMRLGYGRGDTTWTIGVLWLPETYATHTVFNRCVGFDIWRYSISVRWYSDLVFINTHVRNGQATHVRSFRNPWWAFKRWVWLSRIAIYQEQYHVAITHERRVFCYHVFNDIEHVQWRILGFVHMRRPRSAKQSWSYIPATGRRLMKTDFSKRDQLIPLSTTGTLEDATWELRRKIKHTLAV